MATVTESGLLAGEGFGQYCLKLYNIKYRGVVKIKPDLGGNTCPVVHCVQMQWFCWWFALNIAIFGKSSEF